MPRPGRMTTERAKDFKGTLRQLLAICAQPDRSAQLRRISTPTLLIHGALDPLVPVAAAHHLATVVRLLAGILADVTRLAGMAGNFIDADRHLLDAGGHVRCRFALLVRGGRHLAGGGGHCGGRLGNGRGTRLDAFEVVLQGVDQAVAGLLDAGVGQSPILAVRAWAQATRSVPDGVSLGD